MRFEIQVTVNGDKMKSKKLITKNEVGQLLNFKVFMHFFSNHIIPITGRGNYYNLSQAKSKCSQQSLKNILETIHEHGGIHKAKELYSSTRKKYKKFSKLINDLYKLNINPVTLPKGEIPLEGLYIMIEEAIKNEKRILLTRRNSNV